MKPKTLLAVLFIGPLVSLATAAGAQGSDPLQILRARVLAVAEPAFRSWIGSLPRERLSSFGFLSPEAARRASLLSPVAFYWPARSPDALTRAGMEAALEDPPKAWFVPVAVDGRIVCLVTVETEPEKAPAAIEFGKPWAASRLDAGTRLLREQGELRWEDLRFFNSPNIDLLLVRRRQGWKWIALGEPSPDAARALEATQIEELLGELREHPHQRMP